MDIAAEIRTTMADEWLPAIYEQKIRSQRTRSITLDIPDRENAAEIQYTLLGIELRVGKRRFPCPDLAAARYMRVFARVGCREFAIPYDITKVSVAADEFETAWQRSLLLLGEAVDDKPTRSVAQIRAKFVRSIRDELNIIGPGEAMPRFDRETKQRQT
jgi:hypothetical protein